MGEITEEQGPTEKIENVIASYRQEAGKRKPRVLSESVSCWSAGPFVVKLRPLPCEA
jgi:hypothetical protein